VQTGLDLGSALACPDTSRLFFRSLLGARIARQTVREN